MMSAVAMVGREREQGDAGLSCSRLNRIIICQKHETHNIAESVSAETTLECGTIVVPKHTSHSECAIGAQDESGFGSSGG